MKTIVYKKKQTNAQTQYNETLSKDLKWVLQQCKRIVELAETCEQEEIEEGARLYSRNGDLPRQKTGKMNTCKSMCQGVIENFDNGQYDLSEKQIEGLTIAFNVAHDIIDEFEAVVFEEVQTLPKLKSTLPPPIEELPPNFGDLFDVEELVVKYKRK